MLERKLYKSTTSVTATLSTYYFPNYKKGTEQKVALTLTAQYPWPKAAATSRGITTDNFLAGNFLCQTVGCVKEATGLPSEVCRWIKKAESTR